MSIQEGPCEKISVIGIDGMCGCKGIAYPTTSDTLNVTPFITRMVESLARHKGGRMCMFARGCVCVW